MQGWKMQEYRQAVWKAELILYSSANLVRELANCTTAQTNESLTTLSTKSLLMSIVHSMSETASL